MTRSPIIVESLPATWLPGAGNLTPVAAKREFLDQIGNGFADREEFHFDVAVGRHVCDPSGESQWLREAIS
jgi:hypothetical protein